MNLKRDESLSNVAFNLDVRRYNEEIVTSVMLQGTGFDELRTAMQKLRGCYDTFKPDAMPKYW